MIYETLRCSCLEVEPKMTAKTLLKGLKSLYPLIIKRILMGDTSRNNRFSCHLSKPYFFGQPLPLFGGGDSIDTGDLIIVCEQVVNNIYEMENDDARVKSSQMKR